MLSKAALTVLLIVRSSLGLQADVASDNVFHTILGAAPSSTDLRVEPCEGAAPMLCIDVSGIPVVVELLVHPLSSQPELLSILEDYGQDANGRIASLEKLASRHLEVVAADRKGAHGAVIRFVPMPGEPVEVGELAGWRYGFTVRDGEDRPIERHMSFIAVDSDSFYVLAVPFDADPLPDEDVEHLQAQLTRVMASLLLPVHGSE